MTKMIRLIALCSALNCAANAMAGAPSPQVPPNTPAAVVESLVTRLNAIAAQYPELKGFPEYAASRTDKLRIDYDQGRRPSQGKTIALEDKGLSFTFQVADDSLPSQPAASAMASHLAALHLSVYGDVLLSDSPSPGLRELLRSLIAEHIARLEKLNEAAAGNPVKQTPPP